MQLDELEALVKSLRDLGRDYSGVEVKASGPALPSSVKETLSSFSNTAGGTIILGLDESAGFAATGVSDPAKIAADLASTCASELEPAVRPVITHLRFEGADLIVAEVHEIDPALKPSFVKARGMTQGSYIRVNDGDQRMSPYEVQTLVANRGQPLSDAEPVAGTSSADLDPGIVSAYLERVKSVHPRATTGLDDRGILRQARILVDDESGNEVASVGGLLAMGKYPQAQFPQMNVTLVVYPTERGPNTGTGARFLDNVTLDGPIPIMARDALAALRRNMARRATVTGIGRTDSWEYPEPALREAIVNALVHRDLSPASRGTQVQIEMYPDRLSIRNPGGLFGPVSVEDLTEHEGTSSARNSFLLKVLEDVVLPDDGEAVCENRGSGIRTMVDSLRAAGMSVPRFDDRIASFSVTFPNHTLLDERTVAWLGNLGETGLTDSQVTGLAMLRSGEKLDNPKYRAATGVDSRIATAELQDLVTRELVAQVGYGRWTEYRLAGRAELADQEGLRRLSPRDRRPMILAALDGGALSRADIEKRTGLSRKVVIRWLQILRKERLIKTENDVSPQNPNVRYERTLESWGQNTLDFDVDSPPSSSA